MFSEWIGEKVEFEEKSRIEQLIRDLAGLDGLAIIRSEITVKHESKSPWIKVADQEPPKDGSKLLVENANGNNWVTWWKDGGWRSHYLKNQHSMELRMSFVRWTAIPK